MPEIVACPDCNRKLRVPDNFLGKKVKCPQCNAMFKAEAPGEDDDAPRPKKRGGDDNDEDRDTGSKKRSGSGGGSGGGRSESLADRALARTGGAGSRRKPDRDEEDEEEEERPRSRRGRDRDEEEEDDRPSRRRGRDRDEEDEDDRPSRRRARDDYDDDDDDRSRGQPSRKQQKAGWRSVSFGLLLIIISVWIYIGTFFVGFLGNMMAGQIMDARNGGAAGASMAGAVMILQLILNLLYYSVNIVGHGFTLGTPARPGWATRPLGITSFSCLAFTALSMALFFLWGLITVGLVAADPFAARGFASGAPLMMGLLLLGLLTMLAGSIVFMFYLSNVCLRIGRRDLSGQVITCFISIVAAVVICFFLFCLIAAIAGGMAASMAGNPPQNASGAAGGFMAMGFLGVAVGCVGALVSLCLFIWYVVLLYQVRGALDYYIRRKL